MKTPLIRHARGKLETYEMKPIAIVLLTCEVSYQDSSSWNKPLETFGTSTIFFEANLADKQSLAILRFMNARPHALPLTVLKGQGTGI